jgi:hypothetical protein
VKSVATKRFSRYYHIQMPRHLTCRTSIQFRASSLGELLEDAAKADEAIIYTDNDELTRILWERIGNADIA